MTRTFSLDLRTTVVMVIVFGSFLAGWHEDVAVVNTFSGYTLFGMFFFGGVVFAIPMSFALHKRSEPWTDNLALTALLAFGVGNFFASAAVFINRTYSSPILTTQSYQILSKARQNKERKFYVFVAVPHDKQRIQVSEADWKNMPNEGKIRLSIIPGYFGFGYVQSYEIENETQPIHQHGLAR